MKHICVFLLSTIFCASFNIAAKEPDWNQYRGPNHDNKSASTNLLKSWPDGGPKLLWKIDTLGEGYSNVSFFGDKMFTMGDIGEDCCVIALDKNTGKQLWKTPIGSAGAIGRYAGPRSTPAVDGKHVFAYSQYGDFACLDVENGKVLWNGNVQDELGGKFMNNWGFASSPIFDPNSDNVLIPVGGEAGTLLAFGKDGKRPWRSKELKDDAPYSSPVPVEIEGVKQFLLLSVSGVSGISAEDGSVLWKGSRSGDRPVCSDPICKDGYVFVSSAYNIGSHGFKITKNGDKFEAKEIYAFQPMQNHHGGIVLVEDYVYFTTNRTLVCLNIKTGETAWENPSVGKGSLTFADGNLIVRSEQGEGAVALVEASPNGHKEKGRFNQPDRSNKNSWTYPVVVDGRLFLRDQNMLFCYDLGL